MGVCVVMGALVGVVSFAEPGAKEERAAKGEEREERDEVTSI